MYLCRSIISVGGKLRWPLMGVHQSLAGQVGSDPVVVVVVVVVFIFFVFGTSPETSMGMVFSRYLPTYIYEMAYDFLYWVFM